MQARALVGTGTCRWWASGSYVLGTLGPHPAQSSSGPQPPPTLLIYRLSSPGGAADTCRGHNSETALWQVSTLPICLSGQLGHPLCVHFSLACEGHDKWGPMGRRVFSKAVRQLGRLKRVGYREGGADHSVNLVNPRV